MPLVIAEAFGRLPVGEFRIQVNNRKIPEGFFLGIGLDRRRRPRCASSTSSDKIGPEPVAEMLIESGASEEQARQVLALASISSTDLSFVDAVRALGVQHPTLDEGLDALAAVIAVGMEQAPGRAGRRPQHRPRPRLLHRHGLRDPARRVRVVGLGLLRAAATTRWPPTAAPPTRGWASRSGSPGSCTCSSPSAGSPPAARPRPPCSSPSSTRRAARPPAGWPRRCGRAASRARWRPAQRSSASRSATPTGAASRSSGSPGAGEGGDQVKDIRSGEQVDADAATWQCPGRPGPPSSRRPRSSAPALSRRRLRPPGREPVAGAARCPRARAGPGRG